MLEEKQKRRFRITTAITGFTVIAIYYFVDPVSFFFPKCPLYFGTGLHCTGCGSQRALHALLNGNIMGAWRQNMLATLCYIGFFFELIAILFNSHLKPSALLQKKNAAIIVLSIVLVFTVLRNIPIYPFTLLAPYTK